VLPSFFGRGLSSAKNPKLFKNARPAAVSGVFLLLAKSREERRITNNGFVFSNPKNRPQFPLLAKLPPYRHSLGSFLKLSSTCPNLASKRKARLPHN
jgi:hypothetical protein